MNPTALTILSYTVPATLLGGLTMWHGHEKHIRWNIAESLFVFLPFLFVFVHVAWIFGGIDNAVAEMELHPVAVALIAATGGILGGMTLIPRLWVAEGQINRLFVSFSSSFVVALVCLKMFFLAVVMANPRSVVPPP